MSKQGIPSGALGMYPESKHLPNLNPGVQRRVNITYPSETVEKARGGL